MKTLDKIYLAVVPSKVGEVIDRKFMRERKLTQSFISVASHSLSGDIREDREEGSSETYW